MTETVIQPLASADEAARCAEMMAATDPWRRLGRDYAACYKAITDPTRDVFVAKSGEAVVGLIILSLTGAFVGYLQSICVAEGQRGKGVGSQLIRFAEDYIFARSPNVFMCVSSFNTEAQRLYARLGYRVVGELDDYVIAGASEILLRKSIAPLADWTPLTKS